MHGQSIHVLLVEDNAGDARLVMELMREAGAADFCFEHVTTVQAGELYLQSGTDVDAVLLDLSLPDETGLQTVRRIVSAAGLASVVVMTGADDEELGVAAMQEGAQDYLVKGKVDGERLRRVVRFAIERQDRLKVESQTDDLTGLHNRRGFLVLAEQQISFEMSFPGVRTRARRLAFRNTVLPSGCYQNGSEVAGVAIRSDTDLGFNSFTEKAS
jgi:DNA-binding response OmpR family regulator